MLNPRSNRFGASAAIVWNRICRHLDGIALAPVVESLAETDFFRILRQSPLPVSVNDVAATLGLSNAFLHLFVRILADQGWLERICDPIKEDARLTLTETGKRWIPHVSAFTGVSEHMRTVSRVRRRLEGSAVESEAGIGSNSSIRDVESMLLGTAENNLREWLEGAIHAAFVPSLLEPQTSAALRSSAGLGRPDLPEFSDANDVFSLLGSLLKRGGLATVESGKIRLTSTGEIWLSMAGQYLYASSHLELLAESVRLLPDESWRPDAGSIEKMIHRKLDVRSSKLVFDKICRTGFVEILTRAFVERARRGTPPASVVDVGCGDGTMLCDAATALAEVAGQLGVPAPLAIGIDFSPVSVEEARRTLCFKGLPHFCGFGNVGDPKAISQMLARDRIDFRDSLHIGKSVIHNRSFPGGVEQIAGFDFDDCPPVHIDVHGNLIPHADSCSDLVRHFKDWTPWIERHGIVVIEAHIPPSPVIANAVGRIPLTLVDLLHGLTKQMLLPARTFHRAILLSGLSIRETRAFAEVSGHPLLTATWISHGVST
jgi:SAM-dependent methyltransferase